MLFPEVAPGRAETQAALAQALSNPTCHIYVDASVLTLGYDISAGAREEMLAALEQFGDRMHIPLWAAQETWNNGRTSLPDHPLKAGHSALDKAMRQFLKTALSQLDEEFTSKNGIVKKADFEQEYRDLADRMSRLTSNVGEDRKPERISEKLTPFINRFVLRSDLTPILDRVSKEGPFRHAHGIPPGHADIRKGKAEAANGPVRETNQFGDLIIWFEMLEHARFVEATEVLFLTKDFKKGDWVYWPRKVKDDVGRSVGNKTLTLPMPLLVSEATATCAQLQRLHITTLDEMVRVLASLSQALPQLSVALQPETDEFLPRIRRETEKPSETVQVATPANVQGSEKELSFRTSDLAYEPAEGNELDELISEISSSDWHGQNRAAAREVNYDMLTGASKPQRIRFGRVLARAANGLAVRPLNLLGEILAATDNARVSREVFLGVLAEIYLHDDGTLKRPVAAPVLAEMVFASAREPLMKEPTLRITERMDSQRRNYLALPDETPRRIALEATLDRSASPAILVSLKADGEDLLGAVIHRWQRFPAAGLGAALSSKDIIETVATQFVVPISFFEMDNITTKFSIADQTGFVPWGPGSGIPLRQLP